MRRFRVAEESMSPVLVAGDIVLAARDRQPPAGAIVVFPHPKHPGSWLVKRVTASDGTDAWVESDNPAATMADSRTLGWIPTAEMHRAILRYRRPFSWARL